MSDHPVRLSLTDVRRAYDGVPAVDGVSFDVHAGEIVCLLGPSGCGKSTTMRLAAGLERVDDGQILIDGQLASARHAHVAPERRGIGLMFQDYALFPHLTVAENVAFGLTSLDRASRRRQALEGLDRVGLADYADAHPHVLSGGQQQRVALARALAPKPRIMLMDEPFSGLDSRLRDQVRDDTLARLEDEGAAVLLVTHDPDEALRMADRIVVMRAGRIVQIGPPAAFHDQPADADVAAFFGEVTAIPAIVGAGAAPTPFGPIPAPGFAPGALVDVLVRQDALIVEGRGPAVARPLEAMGRVRRARHLGHDSLVEIDLAPPPGGAGAPVHMTLRVPGRLDRGAGAPIRLTLDLDQTLIFPARS